MVIFFSEDDVISFGYYMISKQRKDFFANHPDFKDNVVARLQIVDELDLANWSYITNQQQNLEQNAE